MKQITQRQIWKRLKFGKRDSERSRNAFNAVAAKTGTLFLLVSILQIGVVFGCQELPRRAEQTTPSKQSDIDGPDGLAGMPEQLPWQDYSPGWTEPGQKLLVTGVIFQPDGKTPASNVVLYYYHTNAKGRYIHRPEAARSMAPNELGQTHGYLRGWIRTGADGKYAINTVLPAPYPNDTIAAHIHATIKEPEFKEYYIDDFVFDSDPVVDEEYRKKEENRCGSGILHLERKEDLLVGKRDIILGLNIPGHPAGQGVKNNPSNIDGEPAAVTLSVPDVVLDGTNPGIKVAGLKPEEVVRVHVLRSMEKWKEENGNWQQMRQGLHAWADFTAPADGTVDVDTQTPVRGTYAAADPLALLRTGYRIGDPALRDVLAVSGETQTAGPSSQIWVKLEQNGKIVAEADFELNDEAKGIEFTQRSGDGWHAVYARPADGKNLPVVISLHGSEGGSIGKARGRASPFASRGFAAVAVNYFSYPHEAVEGIPTQHTEIKVEILDSIREWLATLPEVDMKRIHVIGVSKGAEFALLAASKFDWIHSAVALVPSDIVWEGYSDDGATGTAKSSWSIGDQPVPFVPLFPFDPKMEGMYRTNTERYSRSRDFHSDRVSAARIPVENIKARILLLASDRDEVWASGEMARNIVERMVVAGKADQVEVKIYPTAGHQITGTGTFPVRLYGEQSPDPDAKDILAEGAAAADAFRRTVEFLNR